MNELNAHYGLLLGLNESWEVVEVNVAPECRQVEILLNHRGGKLTSPECQQACTQADLATERESYSTAVSLTCPRIINLQSFLNNLG